ncbi:MAG: nucleotidyltransferase family protein [Prevotella sp.]|nr:nucleotidyltransferase family protein [Prevotella sp.]
MTQTIAEYFKTQPVLKAWLFGSYARGEERPDSDVDILVAYDDNKDVTLFTIGGMYMDLKKMLGHEVDLVEEGTLRPWAVKSVERDKKLIYERANNSRCRTQPACSR